MKNIDVAISYSWHKHKRKHKRRSHVHVERKRQELNVIYMYAGTVEVFFFQDGDKPRTTWLRCVCVTRVRQA